MDAPTDFERAAQLAADLKASTDLLTEAGVTATAAAKEIADLKAAFVEQTEAFAKAKADADAAAARAEVAEKAAEVLAKDKTTAAAKAAEILAQVGVDAKRVIAPGADSDGMSLQDQFKAERDPVKKGVLFATIKRQREKAAEIAAK